LFSEIQSHVTIAIDKAQWHH